jgi:hypothetical protein
MMAVVGSESSFDRGRQQLELLAGLKVTAKAAGRHAGALVPRIRSGDLLFDSGFRIRLPHPDAHAVQPLSKAAA